MIKIAQMAKNILQKKQFTWAQGSRWGRHRNRELRDHTSSTPRKQREIGVEEGGGEKEGERETRKRSGLEAPTDALPKFL